MNDKLIEATARIVSGYLSGNPMAADQVPAFIQLVAENLARLQNTYSLQNSFEFAQPFSSTSLPFNKASRRSPHNPAVPIAESVTDDYIICLEDGQKLKMLKRHLMSVYGLTPEAYRKKWNLPKDYPMVCRNYAHLRSKLAKEGGLGSGGPVHKKTKIAANI